MKKIIIITLASLFLIACRDSGTSSGSESSSASTAAATAELKPKAQDLVAPEASSFDPIIHQTLEVNLSGSLPARAQLSVYSHFTEQSSGSYRVDTNSQVVHAAITNGALSVDFVLPKGQSSVVAEIWFYDGETPLQKEFAIDGNELIWD